MTITKSRASASSLYLFVVASGSGPTAMATLRTAGAQHTPQLTYLMNNIVLRGLSFTLIVLAMNTLRNVAVRFRHVRELVFRRLIDPQAGSRLSPVRLLRVLGCVRGRRPLAAATDREFRSDSATSLDPRDAHYDF